MRHRVFVAVSLFAVGAVAAVGWVGWRRDHQSLQAVPFLRQRLAFVEAENRRLQGLLADQQRRAEADVDRNGRTEIESTVTRLRSLNFLRPVVYREIPRSDLPAVLHQKLSQQVPDTEFDRTGIALAALGLIPHGLDMKKTYLALLGEQVGAFYDQHTRELFTFSGHSLADSQNRVIMAHELTHALEDQHFHLDRLPLEAKGNDDRALAASALVEGDATLVMNRYMLGNLTGDAVRESLATAITTDVRQLASAPRFLRETLLFPYLRGQEFCQLLYQEGGWPALARAFEKPPSSTAQILHPERFLSEPREEPIPVDFGDAGVLNEQPISDNVLGEFGLRQWLVGQLKNDQRAIEMADGWRGDRYLVYGDARAASYVWESVWRLPGQAEGFARAVAAPLQPAAAAGAANRPSFDALAPTQRHFVVMVDGARQRALVISAQDANWWVSLKTRFAPEFTGIPAAPVSSP